MDVGALGAVCWHCVTGGVSDPVGAAYARYSAIPGRELPRFQSGVCGYL